jgi:hypothetical protein
VEYFGDSRELNASIPALRRLRQSAFKIASRPAAGLMPVSPFDGQFAVRLPTVVFRKEPQAGALSLRGGPV